MPAIVDENGFVLATCDLETARRFEDTGQASPKRVMGRTVYVTKDGIAPRASTPWTNGEVKV